MFQMVNKHIEARILYFPHQIPELGEGGGSEAQKHRYHATHNTGTFFESFSQFTLFS